MPHPLAIIGAPSSAGAYAPGQEKAPHALRAAGLAEKLRSHGIVLDDRGDVPGFRWRADPDNPRAMNVDAVMRVARATAVHVAAAMSKGSRALVLGGDCTVEIGTVAGARAGTDSIGLVYIDFDTDLNTPESTTDGALDWMGVAHMLGIEGATPELVNLGIHAPLLNPDQVLFFGSGNYTLAERRIIEANRMAEVPATEVAADPAAAAQFVLSGFARRFDRLLIHLDVDVLDFADIPLAENTRRNVGLKLDQLMIALTLLLAAPNFAALTICEVNPDHGEADGATLAAFTDALADCFGEAQRVRGATLRAAGA
jgi:arginase